MREDLKTIYNAYHDALTRYTYFLNAACAAGIAISIQLTTGKPLSWSMLPLGIAVASWGAGFLFGVNVLISRLKIMNLNRQRIEVQSGAVAHTEPTRYVDVCRDLMDQQGRRAFNSDKWQLRLIVAGAVAFITWHILEMAKISPPAP